MELKRVVVTGIGALSPLGKNKEETWSAMINGVSGAAPITHFDTEHFKTKFACELKGFDPLEYFDRKEARKLDPFAQFAIVAADEALEESGLLKDGNIDLDTVGVIWGTGIGGIQIFENEVRNYERAGVPKFNPFFIPKMIIDITAGHISMKDGLRGPNFSYCICMCLFYECTYRCVQLHSLRKSYSICDWWF